MNQPEQDNAKFFAKLKAEVEPYKNTLVLDGYHTLARLVGVMEGDHDFYYVVDRGEGLKYYSCVGTFIPLKGFIKDEHYNRLVYSWNLNHIEQAI